eukprot:987601_1
MPENEFDEDWLNFQLFMGYLSDSESEAHSRQNVDIEGKKHQKAVKKKPESSKSNVEANLKECGANANEAAENEPHAATYPKKCTLCKAKFVGNATSWREHSAGRKHKKAVARKEKKAKAKIQESSKTQANEQKAESETNQIEETQTTEINHEEANKMIHDKRKVSHDGNVEVLPSKPTVPVHISYYLTSDLTYCNLCCTHIGSDNEHGRVCHLQGKKHRHALKRLNENAYSVTDVIKQKRSAIEVVSKEQ